MSNDTIETTETEGRTFASLPFDALWDEARDRASNPSAAGVGFTAVQFAEMVGHNVKAVNRWAASGRVPWLSADRAACSMGLHPWTVWGDEWLNVKGDYDQIATGAVDDLIERDWQRLINGLDESITLNGFEYGRSQILSEVSRWIRRGVPKAHARMAKVLDQYGGTEG